MGDKEHRGKKMDSWDWLNELDAEDIEMKVMFTNSLEQSGLEHGNMENCVQDSWDWLNKLDAEDMKVKIMFASLLEQSGLDDRWLVRRV